MRALRFGMYRKPAESEIGVLGAVSKTGARALRARDLVAVSEWRLAPSGLLFKFRDGASS